MSLGVSSPLSFPDLKTIRRNHDLAHANTPHAYQKADTMAERGLPCAAMAALFIISSSAAHALEEAVGTAMTPATIASTTHSRRQGLSEGAASGGFAQDAPDDHHA
jgi:hypothetical protein